MFTDVLLSPEAVLTYSAYLVASSSPGPSNLAIMSIAMSAGRKASLTFALGVVCGALFWALLAALGLSTMLAAYSQLLLVIKISGGLYLLWLAYRSARSALQDRAPTNGFAVTGDPLRRIYLRGVAMHLTNPKAIFVWMSIVSLSLPAEAGPSHALIVVAGCMVVAVLVFCGYAIVFSVASVRRAYAAVRRWYDGIVALAFAGAGLKLIASRN